MTNVRTASSDAAPLPGASLPQAMARFVGNSFRLGGRASRSEYWWWMVVNLVVLGLSQLLLPWMISGKTPQPTLSLGPFGSWAFANVELFRLPDTDAPTSALAAAFLLFAGLWLLATLVPGFTIAVRRLHDSNLSGWWALLAFLPIGSMLLLLLALRGSRPEGRRFDR